MNTNEISGKRQLEFLADFDYIREAGTAGEEKAAERIQKTLDSFGVESHLEEFSFDTFQIKKAKLKVTEPYTKEYTVTGYGRCGNTAEDGLEASFAYAENGDDISLAHVSGKIVMVNDPVRKDMYRKLVKAGAVGFISIAGSPLDEGVDLVPCAYALPKNLPGEEKKAAGKEAQNYDAEHNRAAVHLAFDGGEAPDGMPADYQAYVRQMQESFAELDAILDDIDGMTEGELCDRYLVKSVFYSLYFGADRVRLETDDYKKFADCFVDYEERTQNAEQEDGTVTLEKYTVAVAIGDKTKIFQKLASDYGVTATYEQQSNAVNVWYVAKYDTAAPTEGDEFSDWSGWNGAGDIPVYDLPANGNGSDIVQLALSRLGHPYSQALRGTGNYVDCSYLTLWCYRQIGISLPGTAAEQGRYMVEHNLTVAKESLQPGDLVFWSHKPNGRYMNITHVGIYAGDGMVVDASYSKGKVVYRPLFDNDKQVLYGRPQ